MIVFATIVPHSPLLIPSVGKEHREKLAATLTACQEIEQALYLVKPDTICIIAPHGTHYPDAFSANLAAKYIGNLKKFGDFSTTVEVKSDYLVTDHLQRKLRHEGMPFTLTSNEELDYGYTVPLLLLTSKLANWKLIPISPSALDGKEHYEFGRQLKEVLHAEPGRIAIVASADLSHKLSQDSPAGFDADGSKFDQTVQQAVAERDVNKLLAVDPEILEKVAQCGYRPIITLLGALDGMNVNSKVLSYESPFGVGYMTTRFDIA
ncbi:MAG: AmmeMemoRadiSam system protein B [Patescibacteria group bacterium]|nr:AmmeMemoRadiSam system protein B [Patescibacteria group bacterium]MBU2508845.1 AmmeMemoRadiSam system protein B [Patescibacteria group bacterium]